MDLSDTVRLNNIMNSVSLYCVCHSTLCEDQSESWMECSETTDTRNWKFLSALSLRMHNMLLLVAVWCSLLSVLWLLFPPALTWIVATLGSVLLVGIGADLLVKLVEDLLPRRLMPELHNKAVLITGCSSGFGLATAKRLDALGMTVYAGVMDVQSPGAVELKEACTSNMHVLQLDVTKDEHVQGAVDYVRTTLEDKVLWAVINNAGLSLWSPAELTPDSDYQMMWDVNAMGSVRVTKAFLPFLRKSGGRIVFHNSTGGLTAAPISVAYGMSKFALTAFAQGLRREVQRWGISVHSLFDHFYKTNMTDYQQHLPYVEKNWNNASAEIRDSYGADFIEHLKAALKKISEASYRSINSPLEDLIDAAIGAKPKLCYVSDWKPKLICWGISYLPEEILDWFILCGYIPTLTPKGDATGSGKEAVKEFLTG